MFLAFICLTFTVMNSVSGTNRSQMLEVGQACGESGQLLDAPVPGVYSHHGRRSRRSAVSDSTKLWPGAVVPYTLDSAISASGQRLIRRAMDLWESKTCIRFVKRTKQADYVNFYRGGGCCSHVGRQKGKQNLSLGTGCLRYGIIVHELGHAIGFWHEQNRPDRGNYIDILYNNVEYGKSINFDLVDEGKVRTLDQDYDYKSIMHYGSKFFNRNGANTIRPKDIYRINPNTIGSRYYSYSGDILSKLDILKANIMYKCNHTKECGGTLFGHRRKSFSSEGYPKPYSRKKRNCVWIFNRDDSVKQGQFKRSLTLAFEDFNVGQRNSLTGECVGDFIEVRRGKGFLAPFLARLCGDIKPDPIMTFSDSLYVKFHTRETAHSAIDDSMKFSAYFKTDECSNTLRKLNGVIKSPQFPDVYPRDRDCIWKIKVSQGYRIVIEFEFFKLRSIAADGSCIDYVDLHQIGNEVKFIGRFCGSSNPGRLEIDSNEVDLRLHTSKDGFMNGPAGFHAIYQAVDVNECETGQHKCDLYCVNYKGGYFCACPPGYSQVYLKDRPNGSCLDVDECTVNNGGCSHECINTDGSYFCTCQQGYSLAANKSCIDIDECVPPFSQCSHRCHNTLGSFECTCNPGYILQEDQKTCKALSGCGSTLSITAAVIRAPRIPVSYNREVKCHWSINITSNLGLVLSIHLPWTANKDCNSHLSLKSKQQPSGQAMDMKICSKSDIPREILVRSNMIDLEYHAVMPHPLPFSIRYHSIRMRTGNCKQTYHGNDGLIETPDYPYRYPSDTHCVWSIQPTVAARTKLSFLDFSVEYSEGCKYDYLEIEEHSPLQSAIKRIGRFCGDEISPDIVISSTNDIVIRFVSDATIQKRGVKIRFSKLL